MPLIEQILSTISSDFVGNIVKLFKVPPEQVEQHTFELQKAQLELTGKLQDAMTAEVQAASENIRAEAQSGDKYTSRARPSFIYVMLGIFLCNYIVIPLMGIHGGAPLTFPDALFWLFGSCMLGYTGARSWEKFMGNKS